MISMIPTDNNVHALMRVHTSPVPSKSELPKWCQRPQRWEADPARVKVGLPDQCHLVLAARSKVVA
jgi:hypothetical protein